MSVPGGSMRGTRCEGVGMTPPITFMTSEQIEARRADLLARAGLDLETLRRRADEYRLSPEQAQILDELDDLDFLAGE